MSRRILLFNGVNTADDADSPRLWAPLSILSIGTMLAAANYEPVLLDCQIQSDWRQRVAAQVDDALFFGVTCMTGPGIRNVLDAIAIVRRCRPDIPIVWGGYHATLAYEGILREGAADVVAIGAGESAALAIAERCAAGNVDLRAPWQAFDEIPSVAFVGKGRSVLLNGRTAQQVIVTPRGAAVEMNDLPPLDYSLIDPRAYYTERDQKIPYISSYGCPFACTYCSEPATSGRTWTGLDPRRIVNEGATLWDRYAPQAIDFMDPNFSSRPARVVAFVEEAVKRGNGAQYMCNMRARDVAVLSKMIDPTELRRAGFTRIFIGVESGSDRMLDALKKGARVSDTITATQALARADIEVHVSFMHDLPEEDEEDSIATMELAKLLATLPRNRQSHHFFTPYPGTELFERYFSDHMDISISQDTWASSSTYRANGVWSGRPAFRERVLERLEAIKDEFPTAFEGTRLPHLEMTEAV